MVNFSRCLLTNLWFYSKPKQKLKSFAFYSASVVIVMLGLSYASLPLYRIFCQQLGWEGAVKSVRPFKALKKRLRHVEDRKITINFNASKSQSLDWEFKPQQRQIIVHPGQTALCFYMAKNLSDVPVVGIATYNVVPFEAARYFNKVQCFCFEEQILRPGEEVEMPVFFFIDPDYDDDPFLENCNHITLSYTFYKTSDKIPPEAFAALSASQSRMIDNK